MKNKKPHPISSPFDYESFEKTLLDLKEGQDLLGSEGLLTPLIKEASLEEVVFGG